MTYPPVQPWHRLARPVAYSLGPFLIAQGRWARAKKPRLPNAPKPWSGKISGPRPLHLLGLGDSTIAGVGVDNSMNGLVAQFAKELYRHTGRGVSWDASGERGITTRDLLEDYLPQVDAGVPTDVVLVSIGANDAKNMLSPVRAATTLEAIVDRVHELFPDASIVVSSLPAFHLFRSLPQPLRAVMAGNGQAIERRARPRIEARHYAMMLPPPPQYPETFFAEDGFHPSATGYSIWAEFAVDDLASRGILEPLRAG